MDELSTLDTDSWLEVARAGSTAQVLEFLQANKLPRDLHRVAWRMADKAVFEQVIGLLTKRGAYDDRLWLVEQFSACQAGANIDCGCRRYGFMHEHEGAMRDYLSSRMTSFGPMVDCKLGSRSFGDSFQVSQEPL